MHYQTIALAFALSAVGLAQDVDRDDIPQQCVAICQPIVTLTQNCDNTTNDDDDRAERQCVCNGQNASTIVPLCASCITQNGGEFDNDVSELVRECSFSSTSYAPSAASTALASGASATPTGSMNTPMTTGSMTTGTGAAATGTSNTQNGNNAQPTQTDNAAAAPTMALAAAAGGLLGFAGLIL
ncbi:gpi anchored protein [Stemphylium lycopersici]|uniref:Gpi anchored protein n=1 Tax=Stemphylium lycopersici TaxID=183478 RepID=A0A364MUD8_STELY|nr:gpi anchored protein [Stemphylium lycopersici]RAQ99074.1 gpi anchored protein [Stemphylium lycopersici]RAR03095.1 gpi anchored protein [Stemphylium lycopersici]